MTTAQDRAAGMLAGVAYGDALGARYEGLHLRLPLTWARLGRGVMAWRTPGWWTDDTDMSLGILLTIADLAGVGYPALETGTRCRSGPA